MMRNRIKILLSILLLLLTACGQNKEVVSKDNNPSESGKLQKVSLMLDWYPNAVHSFLYTAVGKGYFEEQGLDVEIHMPADTNDPLKLVATGKIDMALSYQPQVLVARSEDIPVKSFAAVVRHPLNQLMVLENSSIQTPKDLVGKKIGYPSIPLDEAIIQTMVKSDGGNAEKVEMVDVGWDLIPAIATEKTDALIGGFINHEKLLLEKEGHPIRIINPADYGVPDYYELVLVSSDEKLAEEPEMFGKFMAAVRKSQQYVVEHPEEALSILMEQEDQTSPLEKDIETKSLEILLPLMDAEGESFGSQDVETWNTVAEWLKEHNVISEKVKAEEAFVNY
jgi:putative hydroxymethylpyrimidine transport system substrate-binding protein